MVRRHGGGAASAAERAYYAHPGNRFWRALHEAKITPRLFAPQEYPLLLDLGIGLTDFCKISWGVDSQIAKNISTSLASLGKSNG